MRTEDRPFEIEGSIVALGFAYAGTLLGLVASLSGII